MAMIRPLIIAPHIFWQNDSVAFVERPFFSHLSSNFFYLVYLCNDRGNHSYYPELSDIKEVPRNQLLNYLIRALNHTCFKDYFNSPDKEWYIWGKRAKSLASQLIEGHSIDYVHTCSNPSSDHLIGLYLKNKYEIPWVAQFFDPWSGNPYRFFRDKKYYYRDKKWEYDVALHADLIIHNSEAMRDLWIDRYGDVVKDKIHVLPMAYEFREKSEEVCSSKQVVFSHIGNLYGDRSASSFIKAIDIFLNEHPENRSLLKVNFVGYTKSEDINLVHTLGLDDVFNVTGRLSPDECERYYVMSDVFICIDANDSVNNYFFPSKLLNYFYYGKPILGITPVGSVMNKELLEAGHKSISNSDIPSIVNYVTQIFSDKYCMNTFDIDYWKKFTPESVATQYESIIKSWIG